MQTEFLTTEQAADFLTIKPNTLEIWRLKGKGPTYVKFGRAVRYKKTDIDAWINSQVRTSTSDNGHRG